MTDSMQPAEHISDVLIIGSGAAGLTLALKLADSDSSIHIDVLSKGPESEGSTSHAQGGIAAVRDTLKDNDSIESHVQDTLIAGAGLCDEAAVRFTAENAKDAIDWLITEEFPSTRMRTQRRTAATSTTSPARAATATGESSTPQTQPARRSPTLL